MAASSVSLFSALYLACASTCACGCGTDRIARSISAWILGFLSMAI